MAKTFSFYSIPDTFRITLNTGDTKCSKITMSMKGGLMPTSQIMEWPAVNPNEDFTYEVAMNDFLDDKEDLGNYPVQFHRPQDKNIRFASKISIWYTTKSL